MSVGTAVLPRHTMLEPSKFRNGVRCHSERPSQFQNAMAVRPCLVDDREEPPLVVYKIGGLNALPIDVVGEVLKGHLVAFRNSLVKVDEV